jgi:hypothetical protein
LQKTLIICCKTSKITNMKKFLTSKWCKWSITKRCHQIPANYSPQKNRNYTHRHNTHTKLQNQPIALGQILSTSFQWLKEWQNFNFPKNGKNTKT